MEPYSETNAGLHYDLRLHIDPSTRYLSVSGSVAYHSPQPRLERARFYLHRQFNVQRLEGLRILGYHHEPSGEPQSPFLPQAAVLDVYFNPPLNENETALIQFDYQGTLSDWPAESINVIGDDWAELGMFMPWYPLQYNGTPSNLTFTLKVSCPPGYQVSSYGRYTEEESGWFFSWPHPTNDIVIAVGKTLRPQKFESETNQVFVAASTFGEFAAAKAGEDVLWALDRFSGWFGPTRPKEFTLIESPRLLGGGYSRRGLVVLNGIHEHEYLGQREAFLRYLAHEAAHLWWWEAPTDHWEDWLNESFAEFSALLAIRERFGGDAYERFLQTKRERIQQLPPLWGFNRADTSTPEKQAFVDRMLYDKGPLLLDSLCERIGYQRVLSMCRAMLWSGVADTPHLMDLLEELEDGDTRRWMETRLKEA